MPNLVAVTDIHDPRVSPFRDIRERDLVGRAGRFIAEGEIVLRALSESERFRPLSLLIDERKTQKLAPLLERFPESVSVYIASQNVLDEIAGFHLHRGILALGESVHTEDADALLARLTSPAVVLIGIANHDNMGGLFRNAAAFGAGAVLIDSESCDPLYRKSIRVSAGAVLRVPFARFAKGADIVERLSHHGYEALALSPSGKEALSDVRPGPRRAVLFGAEGRGLPEAVLARARTLRIPMAAGWDSLNVATASGIVLHHLSLNPDSRC